MITRPSERNHNLACTPAQPDRVPGQNEFASGSRTRLLHAPPPQRSPSRLTGRGDPVETVFPIDARRSPVERA
jgi:hypothetical protein